MITILDAVVVLPRGRRTVAELAALSGLTPQQVRGWTGSPDLPVLGEGESLHDLALEAIDVLRGTHASALALVDTVVVGGTGPWDRPAWSPAAALAGAAGLSGVHAFEVSNFCNSYAAIARLALDAAAAGRSGHTLVVLQDRLSSLVDVQDPTSAELFNYGDGVAALLLAPGAGAGRYRLLDARSHTDPSWSEEFAGAHEPHRPGVTLRRAGTRHGLRERYVEAFSALAKDVLADAGLGIDDLALVLLNHGDRTTHERTLDALGVEHARSWFNYDHLAHQGSADTLLALAQAGVAGAVAPGDHVLQLTSGLGFSWGATLLEVLVP